MVHDPEFRDVGRSGQLQCAVARSKRQARGRGAGGRAPPAAAARSASARRLPGTSRGAAQAAPHAATAHWPFYLYGLSFLF